MGMSRGRPTARRDVAGEVAGMLARRGLEYDSGADDDDDGIPGAQKAERHRYCCAYGLRQWEFWAPTVLARRGRGELLSKAAPSNIHKQ